MNKSRCAGVRTRGRRKKLEQRKRLLDFTTTDHRK